MWGVETNQVTYWNFDYIWSYVFNSSFWSQASWSLQGKCFQSCERHQVYFVLRSSVGLTWWGQAKGCLYSMGFMESDSTDTPKDK